jgi:hypothetical protein
LRPGGAEIQSWFLYGDVTNPNPTETVNRLFFNAGRIRWADGYPAALGPSYGLYLFDTESNQVQIELLTRFTIKVFAADCAAGVLRDVTKRAIVDLVPGGRVFNTCFYFPDGGQAGTPCPDGIPPLGTWPIPEDAPDPILACPGAVDCVALPKIYGRYRWWFGNRWQAVDNCAENYCRVAAPPAANGSFLGEVADVGCGGAVRDGDESESQLESESESFGANPLP